MMFKTTVLFALAAGLLPSAALGAVTPVKANKLAARLDPICPINKFACGYFILNPTQGVTYKRSPLLLQLTIRTD